MTYYLKYDTELNKNFRILGPRSTSKSVILSTYVKRTKLEMNPVQIPMSCFLTFDRIRSVVERCYLQKRQKLFIPKDPKKKTLIVIDDVHLQANLRINVLEFLRTWTKSNGYFDVNVGHFKRVTDFCVLMA